MKLLISPTDEQEALETILGGADIVDVKNPKEGPLGANFPWIIKKIRQITPQNIEVSCTVGDIPNLPGSTSLAALGAASTGANYIKTSLFGLSNKKDAVFLMQNVVKAAKDYNPKIKIVVAGYADAHRINSVNPMLVPSIASEAGCEIAMLDTAVKDGKTLFDHLTYEQLKMFVDTTHQYGLHAALAGSLRKEQLAPLCKLNVDFIGVRSAACTNNDRLNGRISRRAVSELVSIVKNAQIELNKQR
ncbi:MAG: hypothetical protein GX638_12465 [Crenarchaeota archaeon]|nr:hypothetical protein [Thermoproteota archaeon]